MPSFTGVSIALEGPDCTDEAVQRLLKYDATAEALKEMYEYLLGENSSAILEAFYSICEDHGIDPQEL